MKPPFAPALVAFLFALAACGGAPAKPVARAPVDGPIARDLPAGTWLYGRIHLADEVPRDLLGAAGIDAELAALAGCGIQLGKGVGLLEVAITRAGRIVAEVAGVKLAMIACVLGVPVPESGRLESEGMSLVDVAHGVRFEMAASGAPGVDAAAPTLATWLAANGSLGHHGLVAVLGQGDDQVAVALSTTTARRRVRMRFARAADAAATSTWLSTAQKNLAPLRALRVTHTGAEVTIDADVHDWETMLPTVRRELTESFRIASGSMMPALAQGDHVMVAKSGFAGVMPRRGDMIVYAYPRDPSQTFIKRVVAVGGDHIQIDGYQLTVNGQAVPAELERGDFSYDDFDVNLDRTQTMHAQIWREELDGRSYLTLRSLDAIPPPRADVVVPEGHVFVLGDNRDNSHDSRFWGTVPLANIKGKPVVIYWSRATSGLALERVGLRP